MNDRAISRRDFIKTLGAFAAGALFLDWDPGPWSPAHQPAPFLVSPERSGGAFSIGAVDLRRKSKFSVPIDFLAHSVAADPADPARVAVFPQRPEADGYRGDAAFSGLSACVVDLRDRRVSRSFRAAAGRHFFGHGVFSADGSILFATANDTADGRGLVEVRDGETLRLLGEMPSHGGGPHQMALMAGGRTAVVCNYGLDPARLGRLGLGALSPSLSYIDLPSGKLLGQDRLPSPLHSIRHAAVTERGDAAVGLYFEGEARVPQPCVALKRGGGPLTLMTDPPNVIRGLASTALSAAIHVPTLTAGFTHPAGGQVTFWSIRDMAFAGSVAVPSPQGIALSPDGERFIVTSGGGRLTAVSAATLRVEEGYFEGLRGLNWRHAGSVVFQG